MDRARRGYAARMVALGVVLCCVALLSLLRVLWLWLRRHRDGERPRRPGPMLAATFAALLAVLLAVWATLDDARVFGYRELNLASFVFACAVGGLCALTHALGLLALPRQLRTDGEDAALTGLLASSFAVGSCYGLLFSA